ncbi:MULTISPECIES: SMI1/KNR4 family protein [unclassified Colwellia]|uniref:SMI1/KNR4 family protein n=1 Tax=unclassified Colwellia TaxID=196834 RepID=UPI0026ACD997|nr:SMI1/KNR4 family protein [Colwellia sp. 6M3]
MRSTDDLVNSSEDNFIDSFVEEFCKNQTLTPISIADIAELEARLIVTLPNSYKYLLSNYGLLHTPNVMTKTCDLSVELTQVQDFLSLEDVYSLSKLYEMSGMPKGHILFASDCKGNMFCFKHEDCEKIGSDIPVWFYNQNNQTIEKTADTFNLWLREFSVC